MDAPVNISKSKGIVWPIIFLVVVFLIALYISSKARTTTVNLEEQPDGSFRGTLTDSWSIRRKPQPATE